MASPGELGGQQPSVPAIGFLNAGSAGTFSELAAAFRQGLKTAGYVDGQNVRVEYRWAEGRHDLLPALAAELVERHAVGDQRSAIRDSRWRPTKRPPGNRRAAHRAHA